MARRTTILTLIATLMALTCLSSCGMLGGGVEGRAAQFYNYMVGRTPKLAYSSFLSPAYRKQFKGGDLKKLDQTMQANATASTRYPEATPDRIGSATEGRFAVTVIDPALGDAFRNLQPVKWVRVGTRWYLYTRSSAELKAYGPFPSELHTPRVPAGKSEEPTGKSKGKGK